MPKFLCLGFAACACIANALQIPNVWDIFDFGTVLLAIGGIVTLFWGE